MVTDISSMLNPTNAVFIFSMSWCKILSIILHKDILKNCYLNYCMKYHTNIIIAVQLISLYMYINNKILIFIYIYTFLTMYLNNNYEYLI